MPLLSQVPCRRAKEGAGVASAADEGSSVSPGKQIHSVTVSRPERWDQLRAAWVESASAGGQVSTALCTAAGLWLSRRKEVARTPLLPLEAGPCLHQTFPGRGFTVPRLAGGSAQLILPARSKIRLLAPARQSHPAPHTPQSVSHFIGVFNN